MRTFALRSLGLLAALGLLAWLRPGQEALLGCASQAFTGDELAGSSCAGAALRLLPSVLALLLVAAAVVNLVDVLRFGALGEPPQPSLLAALATGAALLGGVATLRTRLGAIGQASTLGEAMTRAVALLGAWALVVVATLLATTAVSVWLGRKPEALDRPGARRSD